MFYNARMYDPSLSFFISADIIGIGKGDPASRNRYSYTSNNPLRFVDRTGHCTNPPGSENREQCENAIDELERYGIYIHDVSMWSLDEINAILAGIGRLMSAMHWTSYREFRIAMGIDPDASRSAIPEPIYLVRIPGNGAGGLYCGVNCDDATKPKDLDGKRMIAIFGDPSIFMGSDEDHDLSKMGAVMVHELAHAWDDASGWSLSRGLKKETNSYYVDINGRQWYQAGGTPASGYGGSGWADNPHNEREDWAESVAALAYPERAEYGGGVSHDYEGTRSRYVANAASRVTLRASNTGFPP
jgi:hypothetical protein